jgi:UDP-N-acetyl-D-mannosaminuronate dehydrogenase
MPAHVDPAPRRCGRGRGRAGELVVAGTGYVGLGLAADAVGAGFRVTCVGAEPLRIRRLITELAGDDALAAALRTAMGSGALSFAAGPAGGGPVEVAVFAPGDGQVEAGGAVGPMELAAVALAPGLTRRSHVVVVGTGGVRACAELVTGTIGLLTGLLAGPDYPLGFGLGCGNAAAPTVVSGVDAPSVSRTEALFRALGRPTTTVTPPAAAEFVVHLQRALLDMDRRRP